ncbi:GIY-YIG nuclease family protein [Nocardia farcinica]|uniref:GIY-YIG nuclease family protein n=1 Tax=Nocardia farcinica TaxID=37329 RepID=UPI00189463DF|nr:GIY-YIG nuclease family protein [Nocardia farcinica]MBF6411006.1 GIY-YIG nuclease family protein [Nocardia farcinica]
MTDLTLAGARAERDALANRTDVLDKVGVLRTLPDDMPQYHGCIYVVAFGDGSIKVGKTRRPKSRLRTHLNKAAEHGLEMVDLWISGEHVEYAENETALINSLSACAEVRVRETFTGASFNEATRIANGLPRTRLSEAEIADRLRAELTWSRDEAMEWMRNAVVIPKDGSRGRPLTSTEIEAALAGGAA